MTGRFADGSRKRYQGVYTQFTFLSIDLAKLNDYSIIFTEISFYPETSTLLQKYK